MMTIVKIALILLLLVCLLDMPYGYYQFVRFFALVAFGFMAYRSFDENKQKTSLLYFVLAVLFQPFFKIALGRGIWNFVDIVVE